MDKKEARVLSSSVGDFGSDESFYLTMEAKTITIEYARQKLGERGRKMTDKEIENLLTTLRFLCNKAIDGVINNEN
ncbi:MAG: hypothetical protein A3D74_01960 [Candidatus Levybacteria bacterium RIFCSPHIGHO2_02_FULL_37_13]|nr:MAG: hypothetical protein A3D74_01960 [Candidatus Levybacteria bacterium RIFCSPHIGHO2_02_FULL_37_13]OGH29213.1 MAG: hypothetical protein A3E40_02515 [Candidatus Levybacteria bacterium RIFCSPHIGHO2_12_FULL_37_9]OGH39517.1 MAG: hypothetical protein A3B41_01235 [Candidatus Levybacteria bacterium RIFCSPLOWO2_01_FULL_37_26]